MHDFDLAVKLQDVMRCKVRANESNKKQRPMYFYIDKVVLDFLCQNKKLYIDDVHAEAIENIVK